MAAFVNFGISDLVTVSNLAIKLYTRCRDAPREFNILTDEVANLRNLIDYVRMTVKENSLSEAQTEHLLDIGQGCLNCLLDLDGLLQKHSSMGAKTIRGLERFKWDKNHVADLRMRLISNISMLNAFNITLTRSSMFVLEKFLKGFLEDIKTGRHEGSIVSRQTLASIERGDEDVWQELVKELKIAGITEDQINEHKNMITQRIVDAIQVQAEQSSLTTRSFHSATEGGSSHQLLSHNTRPTEIPPELEFPGSEFHWAMSLLKSLIDLFTDAPEEYIPIQEELNHAKFCLTKIDPVLIDLFSLKYHEMLCRKSRMVPVLRGMSQTLENLQHMVPSLRTNSANDNEQAIWSSVPSLLIELEKLRVELQTYCSQLDGIFHDLGTIVLANIEDRIKILVKETALKQRSSSILYSWEDLETELVDGEDILPRDAQGHREAIESFLRVISDDREALDDELASSHNRNGSIGDSVSHTGGLVFDEPLGKHNSSSATTVSHNLGKSLASLTESDDVETTPGKLSESERVPRPKRLSVLFVDLNNTIRSPMAQCYLEYLISRHPQLSLHFSRVLSRGIYASRPGVELDPGVDFMLRDEGISQEFAKTHRSRRLELRDVEKFEYVLVTDTPLRNEILGRWPTRASLGSEESSGAKSLITREDIEGKVLELGSFGGKGTREVSPTAAIDGNYWFHIGAKRIYPGFKNCFADIKSFVADFIFDVTGVDIHSAAMSSSQEIDSRDTSPESSEDESYSGVIQSNPWIADERSGFEELSRVVLEYSGSSRSLSSLEEAPLFLSISDRQAPEESDEQLLHKHHEQFHRLVSLLLTDVGDPDLTSLRHRVMEWEADSSRNMLAVQSAHVNWILEKIATDSAEACKICHASGARCGFVCDSKLEVISDGEADTIARFLEIAIQQSRNISASAGLSLEEDENLRKIRDAQPVKTAPPSIRDDVSVSVREQPHLAHEVSKIRERDAQSRRNYPTVNQQDNLGSVEQPGPSRRKIVRRQTVETTTQMNGASHLPDNTTTPEVAVTPNTDAVTPQIELIRQDFSARAAGARTPKTPGKGPKKSTDQLKPVAVLFLSSWHTYTVIMAEVYLSSCLAKSLRLAVRLSDVVGAGVTQIPTETTSKFNPKKLEKLFKNHGILDSWPQKPQRRLMADDVIEFDHILILDEDVDLERPYLEWQEENPDEAEELMRSGPDWKKNFRARVEMLRTYDPDESKRGQWLFDPKPGVNGLTSKSKLGVPMAAFEKRFQRVKKCIDSWLKMALGYDVKENKFVQQASIATNLQTD